jgi:hypothetical protein
VHCNIGEIMKDHKAALLTVVLALGLPALSLAQSTKPAQGNAAAAISDAVQDGASPYRPPEAADPTAAEAKRAKCESLKNQYNATSKTRTYSSPGTSTQNAQGRAVPKIERDKTRQSLEDTYIANCT